jgi:hypothetical protein
VANFLLVANACHLGRRARFVEPQTFEAGNDLLFHTFRPRHYFRSISMSNVNKEENVAVTKSSFNVANVIAAIALLLLVIGILKFMGVSPI